jgi:hypothetical protein
MLLKSVAVVTGRLMTFSCQMFDGLPKFLKNALVKNHIVN